MKKLTLAYIFLSVTWVIFSTKYKTYLKECYGKKFCFEKLNQPLRLKFLYIYCLKFVSYNSFISRQSFSYFKSIVIILDHCSFPLKVR